MGGLVHAIALQTLYSDSLSIVRQSNSRKNGAARSSLLAEDGDRTVLTSDGGCVKKDKGSSSSSSSSLSALVAAGMATEAWLSVQWLHARTRGDFEATVLSSAGSYHLTLWQGLRQQSESNNRQGLVIIRAIVSVSVTGNTMLGRILLGASPW